jgi:hypothetical protein
MPAVRLDAAPTYSLRTAASKANGGVALPAAPISLEAPTEVAPPPSIDGKGTLINTYA